MRYIWMMGKSHADMCLHIALTKITAGNKTKLFSSPLLVSTNNVPISAESFRNGYVAAFSTTPHSATEKNELGGYVIVPCPSKKTQRNITADWLKSF